MINKTQNLILFVFLLLFTTHTHIIAETITVNEGVDKNIKIKLKRSAIRTSPFDPLEATDTNFVVDDSTGLDTECTFRNEGPLKFDIEITRYVGEVDQDGYLIDPTSLIQENLISEDALLRMPVYDVDYDVSNYDELKDGILPERDVVFFNGVKIKRSGTAESYLIGENKTWILNEFIVPIEIIKFPERTLPGNNAKAVKNDIEIRIDQANIGNIVEDEEDDQYWCAAVDWAALSFKAMPPLLLIHGNNSDGDFWERRGFTAILNQHGIVYDNSINLPTTTVALNAQQLNSIIPEVAKSLGVQNIQIIAHSKGGLDTRDFLSRFYPTLEKTKKLKVHTFITLSTPHRGSVGADLIRAVELLQDYKIANENDRTELAEFLSDNYSQNQYNANFNLSTEFVRNFNATNRLPKSIRYFSLGADADINNNNSLERNEYQEMLDEAGRSNTWDIFVNNKMNTMYSGIGGFSSVTIRNTGEKTFWGTEIWEVVENPTASFQLNDMMVTVNSARYSFNWIGQFDKNHASVADQEIANAVLPHLIYAE